MAWMWDAQRQAQSQGDSDPDSSSSLRTQDAIGNAKSQSPLCGEDVAKKDAD